MMPFDLPESATILSSVYLVQYLDEDGELKTGYEIEGMTTESAIGNILVCLDRLREVAKCKWETSAEDEAEDEGL